ncbi:hypothetical protein UT300012_31900 [Paraclostridium bifermentans]
MKIIRFILKCILEGLKLLIPTVISIIAAFSIIIYVFSFLGKNAAMIFCIVGSILFVSFLIGIARLENIRQNKEEN